MKTSFNLHKVHAKLYQSTLLIRMVTRQSLHMHGLGMSQQTQFETRIDLISELKACSSLERGIEIHEAATRNGQDCNIFVASTLISMYAKCGSMDTARRIFDSVKNPNVVCWNALIFGYAANGQGEISLQIFSNMTCEPSSRTFVAALRACLDFLENKDVSREMGKKLHLLTSLTGWDSDIYVQGSLVVMYAKCGMMHEARNLFDSMTYRNPSLFTALVLGYAENGEFHMTLEMFSKIPKHGGWEPDARILVAALKACANLASENEGLSKFINNTRGKVLHLLALEFGCDSDVYVLGTLIDMYVKTGSLKDARQVFDRIEHPNAACYNALLFGYAENGMAENVLELFLQMGREGSVNERSLVAVIRACIFLALKEEGSFKLASSQRGNALHLLSSINGWKSDIILANSFIDFYGRCGSMQDAQQIFDSMKHPNVVSWTALILGYVDNGNAEIALQLFGRMKCQGCAPNSHTFVVALKACGLLGALELGRSLHSEAHNLNLENMILRNCLVAFYAKCGSLLEARQLFDSHETRDLVTWNALMAGYCRNGDTKGVFDLFEMMQDRGVQANGITFKCILTVCSEVGLVHQGTDYFELMCKRHMINPDIEHYNCMIDLLGRANKLDAAMAILRNMSLTPTSVTWMTVLGASRNVELARLAFESVDDRKSGAYVMMANMPNKAPSSKLQRSCSDEDEIKFPVEVMIQ